MPTGAPPATSTSVDTATTGMSARAGFDVRVLVAFVPPPCVVLLRAAAPVMDLHHPTARDLAPIVASPSATTHRLAAEIEPGGPAALDSPSGR